LRRIAALGEGVNVASLLVVVAVTWTIFGIVGSGFLTSFNIYSIGQIAARDVVLGLAQLMVLATGRLNLAIGSIGAICCSLLGYLLVDANWSLPVAIALVAILGVAAALLMAVLELVTGL
jgi:ribose transport system permease protein